MLELAIKGFDFNVELEAETNFQKIDFDVDVRQKVVNVKYPGPQLDDEKIYSMLKVLEPCLTYTAYIYKDPKLKPDSKLHHRLIIVPPEDHIKKRQHTPIFSPLKI